MRAGRRLFAPRTLGESRCDIEVCPRSQAGKRYRMAIRGQVSRDTLANANATHDWRVCTDERFGAELRNTAYPLNSTTIDLSLSLFPWAPFRTTRAVIWLHTLLDLRGNIPSLIHTCIACTRPAASSSPGRSRTWPCSGAIRVPWTAPPA